ncbi:MAG TPA: biosynthetic peptidoglycan transglycosylase [Longimicrobiaceae bacterium]|nr:biosynthetic peptidoglycan transglycosylase [Longimicrobiaceae bacterium]
MDLRTHGRRASAGGLGWLQVVRSLREVPELAQRNPASTGYTRYRAAQAGRESDPGLTGWVALGEISPYLVCAVLGAEDPTFFLHRGFWWARMRVAIREALRLRRGVRGVSTITQQLARNLYLHPDRSMRRKVQEALITRGLERVLTKERILELYLNVVEWGEGTWGIGMAAMEHFSRPAAELDAFQSVVLASMLPAPRQPLRDQNANRALAAQRRLLIALYGSGIMSRDEGCQVHARILGLEREIAEGVPARDVLLRLGELSIEPTLQERPEVTIQGVVAAYRDISGRRRGLARLMRNSPQGWRTPEVPLWWTGEPEQEPARPGNVSIGA